MTPPDDRCACLHTYIHSCVDDITRAKDSWTHREKRNLTSTDIALASTRRKAKRPRGWRTEAGGGKVFVTPSSGGARGGARDGARGGARGSAATLTRGQATSMRGRSKRGVAQR